MHDGETPELEEYPSPSRQAEQSRWQKPDNHFSEAEHASVPAEYYVIELATFSVGASSESLQPE
jgi:hypothetical protein